MKFINSIRAIACWSRGHKHHHVHVRNIYGDEINYRNGNRSEWECTGCGARIFKGYLA